MNRRRMQKAVQLFLEAINERFPGDDLKRTPARVTKAWYEEFLSGYRGDPVKILYPLTQGRKKRNRKRDRMAMSDMILARDIFFYSICVHHLLPFIGRAQIAYIPNGQIVGFSKIARLLDLYSRRLQIQERLTQQVAEALEIHLKPKGVAILIEAEHLCMKIRGVKKTQSRIMTSCFTGCFREDKQLRQSLIDMVFKKKESYQIFSSTI